MLDGIDVLLLDIEGTITDISFVQKVLFPYVRTNLKSYLEKHWGSEETKADLEAIRDLSQSEFDNVDLESKIFPSDVDFSSTEQKSSLLDMVIANVNHWMDLDKKLGPLKQLQGHVWRDAYESGDVKGHLYPDVIPSFKRILQEKKVERICIYSSGSVLAQKLLFTHSCEGDVTGMLSGYFDTSIGAKTDVESYKRIARSIGVDIERILFLTDVEREAYPAREALMKVTLVERDGNAPLSEQGKYDFKVIRSLDELIKLDE